MRVLFRTTALAALSMGIGAFSAATALAADAAIGVVKISGKAVGAAADAVFAGDEAGK